MHRHSWKTVLWYAGCEHCRIAGCLWASQNLSWPLQHQNTGRCSFFVAFSSSFEMLIIIPKLTRESSNARLRPGVFMTKIWGTRLYSVSALVHVVSCVWILACMKSMSIISEGGIFCRRIIRYLVLLPRACAPTFNMVWLPNTWWGCCHCGPVSLVGAATSITFVATKLFWDDHTNTCLSQQSTSFVMTKICLSQQNFCCNKHEFVTTKVLLQQAYFCCNKRCVLLWQTCFVVTNMCLSCLLWQLFCHDKYDTCGCAGQW